MNHDGDDEKERRRVCFLSSACRASYSQTLAIPGDTSQNNGGGGNLLGATLRFESLLETALFIRFLLCATPFYYSKSLKYVEKPSEGSLFPLHQDHMPP